MKAILRALFRSLLFYGFFFIFYVFLFFGRMTRMIETSQLSGSQILGQFWDDYGWFLLVPHVLYMLAFIVVQGRIEWLNQHPSSAWDDERLKQEQQKANFAMRWIAGSGFLFSLVMLTGLAFFFTKMQFAISVPLALFSLYVLLAAGGLNMLAQNYLHHLRKRLATTVEEVLAENKAPVLYLRSFLDDQIAAQAGSSLLTEEEQLTKAFARLGPMIAIGRPGEALPEVGAARAYFTDDKWQAAVMHYMKISRLVVLRAGLSQGLIWEIQNSVGRLDPCKLILLIPFEKKAYDEFCMRVQSLFPKPLPDHPGHNAHRVTAEDQAAAGKGLKYGSLLGLIYFDQNWTAHFEKVSADHVPHEYQMIGSEYVAEMMYLMVHYALRPVYARHGLAWDSLGLPWRHN
jgi:hypothetical protein